MNAKPAAKRKGEVARSAKIATGGKFTPIATTKAMNVVPAKSPMSENCSLSAFTLWRFASVMHAL
jgi:hypothetical protein